MSDQQDRQGMADRVAEIRHRMVRAARAAGRHPQEVQLCAVCKGRTGEEIRLSAALAVDAFGENRVQELLAHDEAGVFEKKPCHFIGHLQTNKVARTVGRIALIQSVDSQRLLETIQAEARRRHLVQEILVQVNLAAEKSKTGLAKEDLPWLLDTAGEMPEIRVRGLMAIPPAFDNSPESRRWYARLREMLEGVQDRRGAGMPLDILSMGMTDSYEAAILEGATLIRIGTAIYGPRR